jgi:flagellar hook assembly protein FlgD
LYRVSNLGPASGILGGYGSPLTGNGGFGDVSLDAPYAGNEVKSYNYPNPFNPRSGGVTTVKFTLPRAVSGVKAKLYSMSAELVLDGELGALAGGNSYVFTWDGKNKNGQQCAPGLYFLVIDADGTKAKHKIVLVY